jgi:hypothetical protein
MKKIIVAFVSVYKNLFQILRPERCPACGEKLYLEGHRTTRGNFSKSCLNPDCDWQKQPKTRKTVRK